MGGGAVLWLLLFGLLIAVYVAGLGTTWSILKVLLKIPVWGWIIILVIIFFGMMRGGRK